MKDAKKFRFVYKNKKYETEIKECRSLFSQINGLMFKKNSIPLLFVFKRPVRKPIHSFFCRRFIAIWFSKNKIIDAKKINPWKVFIRPSEKFDMLLEIPENNPLFHEIPTN